MSRTPRPTLLGLPWDEHSSFARGAAGGPDAIRDALHSPSTNSANEDEEDVLALLDDRGNVALEDVADPRGAIEAAVAGLLAEDTLPILLGGDHAVTWPVIRAFHRRFGALNILHIDAHPDLYDALDGDRYSHATPMARIMEEQLASRLVQVGIRTMTPHQREQASRFGVEVVPMRLGFEVARAKVASLTGPLYISLDLDGIDPSAVPGIGHPEPGGFTVREVITLLQAVPRGILVGADVVELNPEFEVRDLTARVAAKLVKEIVGRVGRG